MRTRRPRDLYALRRAIVRDAYWRALVRRQQEIVARMEALRKDRAA